MSPRCDAKSSPSPSPSPSELLGEIRPAKHHWETSPTLWGEMGHASAVRSSFQMGIKFYSLFIDKMINWLSAAQEESREARSRSTATSRARGLETTALEAEAFEMEHLEASRCPAEMAMSEPSGAGEPSGATGDAQARASGSEDALEEATDGTPGSTSGSDSVWSISVQVDRELLGSHSYGCDCRRSVQVDRELLGSHSYGCNSRRSAQVGLSCWVATATGESECVQCNEARVRGVESRSEEHVGVTGVESVRRAERRL